MERDLKAIQQSKIKLLYNNSVPRYALKTLSLEPETGALDDAKARHLLSRCLLGFKTEDLLTLKEMTVSNAVNLLLEDIEMPEPPLGIDSRDEDTPISETWIDNSYNSNFNSYRLVSLQAWWVGQILNQGISLREKMVLFWHNHFVTERGTVNRSDFLYRYNDCLRRNAWGNFQQFTEEITVLPAMLKYLNGTDNVAGAPNENYARELMELFTIGKGPLIEEGNYTNYTEQDVGAAAQVLTGWKINYTEGGSYFNADKHDSSAKTFSGAFNGATINDEGENEYKSLIQLILAQDETARFIVRKLYRWFVYYAIDDAIETNIIEPLAEIFRSNNYELKPVLTALLNSQHFFDENLRGCIIKNPIDFISGTIKQINPPIPGKEKLLEMYSLWNYFFNQAANQEMKLGDPTDVAGWPAYYQAPQYHQLWINAATLPQKATLTDYMTSAKGIKRDGIYYKADLIAVAESTSTPSDVNVLLGELTARFFPFGTTDQQLENLKEILIPGLPDFEWTNEWNTYKENPDNEDQKLAIEEKLRGLLQTMLKMAEYQLS